MLGKSEPQRRDQRPEALAQAHVQVLVLHCEQARTLTWQVGSASTDQCHARNASWTGKPVPAWLYRFALHLQKAGALALLARVAAKRAALKAIGPKC